MEHSQRASRARCSRDYIALLIYTPFIAVLRGAIEPPLCSDTIFTDNVTDKSRLRSVISAGTLINTDVGASIRSCVTPQVRSRPVQYFTMSRSYFKENDQLKREYTVKRLDEKRKGGRDCRGRTYSEGIAERGSTGGCPFDPALACAEGPFVPRLRKCNYPRDFRHFERRTSRCESILNAGAAPRIPQ